jgi:hypothetical protein
MEFDHLVEGRLPVSKTPHFSWRILHEEVAKCEVVRANCHSIRTWMRRTAAASKPRPKKKRS